MVEKKDPKSDRNSDRISCLCKVFNEPIVLIVLKTHCDWLVLELSIRFGSFDPKLKLRYLAANFFSEIHSIYFKLSAQSYYFVQN